MKISIKKYWYILVICLLVIFSGYLYIKLAVAIPIKLIRCEPSPYNNCWTSARFMDLDDCKKAVETLDKYYTYTCAQFISGEF